MLTSLSERSAIDDSVKRFNEVQYLASDIAASCLQRENK